jgi:hypothetical protein
MARKVPSTAATWPCGNARWTVNAAWSPATTVPPLSRALKPATSAGGQALRLHSVRLRTLPPSRYDSRSRIAGGEFRLGTASIYMAA